jgi:hypothetical protein
MAKKIVIASVKKIKSDLKVRKLQAGKVVKALKSGKKAKVVPMKHAGKPALAIAQRIEKELDEAIALMDDICGDNILSNPFVFEEES